MLLLYNNDMQTIQNKGYKDMLSSSLSLAEKLQWT